MSTAECQAKARQGRGGEIGGQVYYEDNKLVGLYWIEERERILHPHGLVLKEQFQGNGHIAYLAVRKPHSAPEIKARQQHQWIDAEAHRRYD